MEETEKHLLENVSNVLYGNKEQRRAGKDVPSAMSCLFFFFFNVWPYHTECGILVPRPGIKPAPPALEALNLNHRTPREFRRVANF